MTDAKTYCPSCGLKDSLTFSEDTLNGAPHGAGFWPMQVKDVTQECDCELSELQQTNAESTAWSTLELDTISRDLVFHTKRFNTLLDAVRDMEQMKTCQLIWEKLQDLVRTYSFQDEDGLYDGLQAPEPEPDDPLAYPDGQCPACGWGLDVHKTCSNPDCSNNPLAVLDDGPEPLGPITNSADTPCDHITSKCSECVSDPNEGLPNYA